MSDMQHRLAAILAADAVGYSRLMSIDDKATVAALDAARAVFRTQVDAQQGRIIDMAGDSVLAVFGAATGAVASALAIQDERVAPDFRIGAHAMQQCDALLTTDAGYFRHCFKGLKVATSQASP